MKLDAKVPPGPLAEKWDRRKLEMKLVSPAQRRNFTILVVGTGLAGSSAAASLGELGYNVKAFCIHDSPRRAHSIGAQGGINAAKNYQNDGDSVRRLFHDTVKGGDFRAREANVYRLAHLSNGIIDQATAQGVPFAREYSGLLANRSFGGAQVSRTFYTRGQTGQQLLLGAYGALMAQVKAGTVTVHPRHEMVELVLVDGQARGIITRNLVTGRHEAFSGDAVIVATGGYATAYYLCTMGVNSNASAIWRAHKKGALFANPCFVQIHPTCLPRTGKFQSKLTLMSESLRNDGRIWVPVKKDDRRPPNQIPENERDYYLERKYPAFGDLVPRDIASRNAKQVCEEGRGVGRTGMAVYLDFSKAIESFGLQTIEDRYGNLFDMYKLITGQDACRVPMRIYPAAHYCMGGLWVDYNLMSTIPGLFVLGEANFSDHGANRLGASALMQGLADGYFIIPATVGNYLGGTILPSMSTSDDAFKEALSGSEALYEKLLSVKGNKTVKEFHHELGDILWDLVGISRSRKGLEKALRDIPRLREEFWQNVKVVGRADTLNKNLEMAGRLADYLELGELMALDALHRRESCGCHFREERQSKEGEALRDDVKFSYVAAWEFMGPGKGWRLNKEPLQFDNITPIRRSYK